MINNNAPSNKVFQIEAALSISEPLPAVDVWLVLDLLRASSTIVTWFERGGKKIYPEATVDVALSLKEEMLKNGVSPLLMGEVNAFPPDGFDAGNSPLEIDGGAVKQHPTAIMATSNGTKAIIKALSTGAAVYIACARNALYAIDAALSHGHCIGVLCAGQNGRPAIDDTICAGLIVDRLCRFLPNYIISDGADIALKIWKNARGSFENNIKASGHAKYLSKIGFDQDISFACERDSVAYVPEVKEVSDFCESGLRAVITCERKSVLRFLSEENISSIINEEQKQIKADEEMKIYKDKIKIVKTAEDGDIFLGGSSYSHNKQGRRNLDFDFGSN
ncbi:MAG: 2-phosphosulfolactate phosphatase [Synergistaceae bacterium]|nr:2-phosphosulfolactate phosphatase [Synergistaceae bacterium]